MKILRRCPLASLLCFLAVPAVQADNPVFSDYFTEPALAFHSDTLANDQLPLVIRRPQFPAVFRNAVNLHCITLRDAGNSVLVYLPLSRACARLDDLRRSQGQSNTAGMNWRPGFESEFRALTTRLQNSSVLAILPQVPARAPAGECSCDGNVPPVVMVDAGQGQTVVAGAPVQIDYSATDVDSEVLMDTFTYQFNGGPPQGGLPAGLVKNCTPGIGTLTCSVTGAAPQVTGEYAIKLEVSDGLASGFATAFLTVLSPDVIFLEGFEENP